MTRRRAVLAATAWLALLSPRAQAHSGPPFPLLEHVHSGGYEVSLWTDPDTTDDGTPGGQFWVVLHGSDETKPEATVVRLTAQPSDRPGQPQTADALPTTNDPSFRFGRVIFDHEGPWRVEVTIDGPRGSTRLESAVEATYDTRPAPFLLGLYALPFLAVGFLWWKAMRTSRRAPRLSSR